MNTSNKFVVPWISCNIDGESRDKTLSNLGTIVQDTWDNETELKLTAATTLPGDTAGTWKYSFKTVTC